MQLDETIAAIATPMQPSGLGVIRVSGHQAVSMVQAIFQCQHKTPLSEIESHKLKHGWILEDQTPIDEVMVAVMRAPHSYTAENVVEIQCHGSPLILKSILDLVLKQGARLAEPGEFTQRAFLNGRLDLTQVEAVADIIHASSPVAARLAAQQLHGKLFHAIDKIKNDVISVASLIEATIEFPDENIEFTQKEACLEALNQICFQLENLLKNAEKGRQMRDGFSIALIGRPNVGKSSLLNMLLREQRAIVTTVPGTTRDTIEESIIIHGLSFRLTDTAGIRQTEDPVETEGIRRSKNIWQESDLALLLLDGSVDLTSEDQELIQQVNVKKTLLILNKKDLWQNEHPEWLHELSHLPFVSISAKSGQGHEELEKQLFEKSTKGDLPDQDQVWITNKRQHEAALKSLNIFRQAREGLEQGLGEELLAVDLRSGLNALGEVVGETTPDDLLGKIFSEFCIGK